ncbi:MAG: hypothetical protein ACPL7K_00890, partial [Armatimonadota bacterium]
MIFDERLLVCVQRIRVRCELYIGLLTQITDDLRAMEALSAPEPDRVIAHDGLFPFTGSDWEQLRTLFSGLLSLRSNPAIDSLFKAAQVRPLDMILRVMPDRFYSSFNPNLVRFKHYVSRQQSIVDARFQSQLGTIQTPTDLTTSIHSSQ